MGRSWKVHVREAIDVSTGQWNWPGVHYKHPNKGVWAGAQFFEIFQENHTKQTAI